MCACVCRGWGGVSVTDFRPTFINIRVFFFLSRSQTKRAYSAGWDFLCRCARTGVATRNAQVIFVGSLYTHTTKHTLSRADALSSRPWVCVAFGWMKTIMRRRAMSDYHLNMKLQPLTSHGARLTFFDHHHPHMVSLFIRNILLFFVRPRQQQHTNNTQNRFSSNELLQNILHS